MGCGTKSVPLTGKGYNNAITPWAMFCAVFDDMRAERERGGVGSKGGGGATKIIGKFGGEMIGVLGWTSTNH